MAVGDATVAADTGAAPAMADAIKTSLAKVRGITGTGRMTSRGVVTSFEMKLPDDADPQSRQAMEQMHDSFANSSAALPEEAVGIGAKWEQKSRHKSGGMSIDETVSYEFISLEGGRLTLRNSLTQSAANQKVENPAAPGQKLDLDKMSGSGTGETTVDLGKAFPVSGNMEEKSDFTMSMDAGGQKQTMSMNMKAGMTLESK